MRRYYRVIPLTVFTIAALGLCVSAVAAEKDFVGNGQCKMCHNKKADGEQWNVWKSMKHSQAYETLLGDKAKELATAKGLETPPAESPECLRCHVTAYTADTNTFHAKVKKTDAVQCESCHGPASLHLADGKKLKFAKPGDPSIDVSANIIRPAKNECVQCHNEESSGWNPEKYTLESGEKVGFDFDQAYAKIAHQNPTKAK